MCELLSLASQNSPHSRETEVGLEPLGRIESKICFPKILSFERLGQILVGLFEQHNNDERENNCENLWGRDGQVQLWVGHEARASRLFMIRVVTLMEIEYSTSGDRTGVDGQHPGLPKTVPFLALKVPSPWNFLVPDKQRRSVILT